MAFFVTGTAKAANSPMIDTTTKSSTRVKELGLPEDQAEALQFVGIGHCNVILGARIVIRHR